MHVLDAVGVKADEYIQQNLVEQTEESVCWKALCNLHFNEEAKNYV